jgi:hypothetical protein
MIEISATTFSLIVGGFIVMVFFLPFIIKEVLQSHARNRTGGLFIDPTHKGKLILCKNLDPGSKQPRVEAPKGYGDYMIQEDCYFDIRYPVGMPALFSIPIKAYIWTTNEAEPHRFYGKEPKYNPLALQAIRNEKVTEVVMQKADDFSDMMKGFLATAKQLVGGKMVTYLLIGLAVAAAGYGAYMTYTLYNAMKIAGYI